MILSDEERSELFRELFALAGRRLEYGTTEAVQGEALAVPFDTMSSLSARIHEVGQDLRVIADAIAVLAQFEAQQR